MRLIDTHCHLNDVRAFPEPAEAIEEALEFGVDRLVVVGINTEWSRIAVELADQFSGVYAVVGWHPTSVNEIDDQALKEIESLAHHPKVVAIGEIGFDFYWDKTTPEQQERALLAQLDLAETLNKPVVFHCREAYPALLDVLERRKSTGWLLHCFAGDELDAERALKLDCYFGVDGPVTYKKADDLRENLSKIGLNRLLIETDAPWLTPEPFRGKRNRPSYVRFVNEALAHLFNVPVEESAEITTQNAEKFFGL
ncbi:TatD family hydrolase [Geitlerinema splendidum]|nr:TatD family hydrolase [Geitlerinema splendidum]